MQYRIGELDQRITVERKERTPDGGGGFVETWTAQATIWALVRPMSGRERAHAQQTQSGGNYLVVVRRGIEIDEACRIIWSAEPDRPLNVRFVKRRGSRAAYLEIEAEMGVLS
jgi:SPP1 family predicted phage head-tail adaptor